MRSPPAAFPATPRNAALFALVAAIGVIIYLLHRDAATALRTLGDTDDAMRLVMVRELLNGRGWFDQETFRLQPPVGLWPHWSRLIDGGLAALYRVLALFQTPADAERNMRLIWPLLWIYPAMLATMVTGVRLAQGPERRDLAGRAAMIAVALTVGLTVSIYSQFKPNRIDHHDVQIVCCLLAFAGLAWGRWKGAVLAGAATAVGLAIGLEALPFQAVAGAGFALRFIQDPKAAGTARAYGLSLAVVTIIAFFAQTPPARWTAQACDALGYNLLVVLAAAGASLVVVVRLTEKKPWNTRLWALLALGLAVAGLYAAMDPHCLKGPFADVDPRLKPIWLDHVQEIKPWAYQVKRTPAFSISQMVPTVMGVLGWLWLGFAPGRTEARRFDALWVCAGLGVLGGLAALWSATRSGSYAQWLAAPLIAAAMADIAARGPRKLLAASALVVALVLSPAGLQWAAVQANTKITAMAAKKKAVAKTKATPKSAPRPAAKAPAAQAKAQPKAKAPARPPPGCFDTAAWRPFAKVQPGLVLSEVDLGPFILAHTGMSALRAPYHRMNYGILQGYEALAAPADGAAEAKVRQLKVDYLLECPSHGRHADRTGMKPESLQKRLDAGKPPAWLETVLQTPTLTLYRVKPAAQG